MIERTVEVATDDCAMTTFVVRPERGGPHPLVLFLMDAAGIREELRDMARRLATCGYHVMAPNLFYRSGVLELPPDASMELMSGYLQTLTTPLVMADCEAMLAHAAEDPAAGAQRVGVVGYCMTGRYAMSLAARRPDRIAAAASFHGVQLATDAPDSPHLTLGEATAEFYFGCAELDRWAPLEMVARLAEAVRTSGANAEVEVIKGADHGFVFPARATYDKAAAEQHWERLIALFRRRL